MPSAFRLLSLFALCCLAPLPAQELNREQFRTEFTKAVELNDAKLMDKVMKRDGAPPHAALYYEELYIQKLGGTTDVQPKLDALKASWERSFEKSPTLDKLTRWLDGMTPAMQESLQKSRGNGAKLWNHALEVFQATNKAEYLTAMQQMIQLARNAEQFGHAIEAAELWGLAAVIGSKIPDRTVEDRREALFATKEFLRWREEWGFTMDSVFVKSREFAKFEEIKIQEAAKDADKRKAEGYAANAKGIDTLVVAGAKETPSQLAYEPLGNWENELDYGPKAGPIPAFWWNASLGKDGSTRKLDWFRSRDLHMIRLGAAKFGMTPDPLDPKKATEVEVSNKPKASSFWLDGDKKVPYAMFFWQGSDRERVGECETNLMPSTDVANIYYRSAASWKGMLGAEPVVFYDDNCNGTPADAEVFDPPFKIHLLGSHEGEGTTVPLLDSMRLGKGPRMPYSEFVKLATGWVHLRRTADATVGTRPLNPDYFKTGKVKLTWTGPKPTAPAQLVVQGEGDYRTAFFDLAGGKETEVPAGTYRVIFGRIVVGKGARAQMATIYQGDSQPFTVEPGKLHELKMGGPFAIKFERSGDDPVAIDALKILLQEASGCWLTDLHGMALLPEVLAAKAEDGKGAKVVGKFVRCTDSNLLNEMAKAHPNVGILAAAFPMPEGYRDGKMVLQVKAGAGMKVGLHVKKHPVFGELKSAFR